METQAPLVYEDLMSFPDDSLRREILGGELYVTPSPSWRHQRIAFMVATELEAYAKQTGGAMNIAPIDTVLSAQNVVEPDVVFVSAERMHVIGTKGIHGVPSLVVEVLSPTTASTDRKRKRQIYARFGIPEYWIVDPDANTIERCGDPEDDVYRSVATFDRDMPAATLPDLVLSFEKIFA